MSTQFKQVICARCGTTKTFPPTPGSPRLYCGARCRIAAGVAANRARKRALRGASGTLPVRREAQRRPSNAVPISTEDLAARRQASRERLEAADREAMPDYSCFTIPVDRPRPDEFDEMGLADWFCEQALIGLWETRNYKFPARLGGGGTKRRRPIPLETIDRYARPTG